MGNPLLRKLREVNHSLLLKAKINESAKGFKASDHSLEGHSPGRFTHALDSIIRALRYFRRRLLLLPLGLLKLRDNAKSLFLKLNQ